jgi:hypothetical protein
MGSSYTTCGACKRHAHTLTDPPSDSPNDGRPDDGLDGSPGALHWMDREFGWALLGAIAIGIALSFALRSTK